MLIELLDLLVSYGWFLGDFTKMRADIPPAQDSRKK